MRVLTVRQPWAWAIIHGGKDVENRTRNIAGTYRGPVAIHAAKREAADRYARGGATDQIRAITGRAPLLTLPAGLGAVIGVVDLVDVHHLRDCVTQMGECSPWAEREDVHHLVLANPHAFATPIPATGRLGLWHPDNELAAAIAQQLLEGVTP